jgi:hypothetical protein
MRNGTFCTNTIVRKKRGEMRRHFRSGDFRLGPLPVAPPVAPSDIWLEPNWFTTVASHWETFSHNVVSNTTRHERYSCMGSCKSNYNTITYIVVNITVYFCDSEWSFWMKWREYVQIFICLFIFVLPVQIQGPWWPWSYGSWIYN